MSFSLKRDEEQHSFLIMAEADHSWICLLEQLQLYSTSDGICVCRHVLNRPLLLMNKVPRRAAKSTLWQVAMQTLCKPKCSCCIFFFTICLCSCCCHYRCCRHCWFTWGLHGNSPRDAFCFSKVCSQP